jgi:hypothetical protein
MKFFTRRRCQQCIMDRRAFFAVSHYKRKFHKTRLKTSYRNSSNSVFLRFSLVRLWLKTVKNTYKKTRKGNLSLESKGIKIIQRRAQLRVRSLLMILTSVLTQASTSQEHVSTSNPPSSASRRKLNRCESLQECFWKWRLCWPSISYNLVPRAFL